MTSQLQYTYINPPTFTGQSVNISIAQTVKMSKLITLYLTTITAVVHGRDCSSIFELTDDNPYDDLTCTTCKALNQFTSVSADLTNKSHTIMDENFTVDSRVRIHICCMNRVYRNLYRI